MQKPEIRVRLVRRFVIALLLLATAAGAAMAGQARPEKMEHVTSSGESRSKALATAGAPVKLGAGPVTVNLTPAPGKEEATLGSLVKGLKPEEHLYVVLRDLRATQPPGVIYDVYLDLPAGAQPAESDPHAIGDLNFYNSTGVSAGVPGFVSFDITDAARQLQNRNQLSERTTITISPSGTPAANAEAVIGRIELVKQ